MTHTIKGASASGVGTCLTVPKYKLVLDIGYCSPEAKRFQTVLITHAHVDHMAGTIQHAASRSLAGNKPSRFICSPEVAPQLEALFTLWNEIQGGFHHEIVSLSSVDDALRLGKNLLVRAVPTYHRVPSQGYIVYEVRKKLKAKYKGLPGQEIGALRRSGVEINNVIETPVLAYLGDTTPEALEHPEIRKVGHLITECTFIDQNASPEYARKRGHTHLDELVPMLDGMAFDHLTLCHFSLRHNRTQIENAMARMLPSDVHDRTTLLLDGDGPVRGW